MNTSETLRKYIKGKAKWNVWANGLLERKEELKNAGKWKVNYIEDRKGRLVTVSADETIPEIQEILDEAFVDFSKTQISNFTGEAGTGGHWDEHDLDFGEYEYEVTGIDFYNFEGFIFPGDVTFHDTVFEGKTYFEDASFHGLCAFTKAEFTDITKFDKATFHEWVNFKEVNFFQKVNLNEVTFKEGVNFTDASFKKKVNFSSTVFKNEADFSSSKFEGGAEFFDTEFHWSAQFHNSIFQQDANFYLSSFFHWVNFRQVDFERHAIFSEAKFKYSADFQAISSKRAFSLRDTIFTSNIPNFIQANFAESPRLDHIEITPNPKYKNLKHSPKKILGKYNWQKYFWEKKFFPYLNGIFLRSINKVSPTSYSTTIFFSKNISHIWNKFRNKRRNPDEEAHYRALKRLAIQAHDHENEMKFFAGEIRSRRHITDFANFLTHDFASSMRYWAGVFYELFSDFGRSFIRPTLWWFACLWLFAKLTLSGAGLQDTTKCHNSQLTPKEAAYTIGLKNSLLILGLTKTNIVKQAELCLYGKNKNGEADREPKPYDPKIKRAYQAKSAKVENTKTDIPFKAAVQGIFHSGLSLLFIFLLLLAIRNQFKIK